MRRCENMTTKKNDKRYANVIKAHEAVTEVLYKYKLTDCERLGILEIIKNEVHKTNLERFHNGRND